MYAAEKEVLLSLEKMPQFAGNTPLGPPLPMYIFTTISPQEEKKILPKAPGEPQ